MCATWAHNIGPNGALLADPFWNCWKCLLMLLLFSIIIIVLVPLLLVGLLFVVSQASKISQMQAHANVSPQWAHQQWSLIQAAQCSPNALDQGPPIGSSHHLWSNWAVSSPNKAPAWHNSRSFIQTQTKCDTYSIIKLNFYSLIAHPLQFFCSSHLVPLCLVHFRPSSETVYSFSPFFGNKIENLHKALLKLHTSL